MKKKTSRSKKISKIVIDVKPDGNFDWRAEEVGYKILPFEELLSYKGKMGEARIVVVIAESPTWWQACSGGSEMKSKKLETGRAMAQACHAVSKLKLSYATWLSQGDNRDKAYKNLLDLTHEPITTICVKARDTKELHHIAGLAAEKHLHCVEFCDENPGFYKTTVQPMTAIAIGPYSPEMFRGITDYLPLWKSPDEV